MHADGAVRRDGRAGGAHLRGQARDVRMPRWQIPSTAHSAVKEYSNIRNILNSEKGGILDE